MCTILCRNNLIPRRRNSTPRVHWNSWKRAGASQSSLSPGWTSLLLLRLPRCLPHPLLVRLSYRAQKRVAQQKLDSKLPLSRIIDIRKRVYADVKVHQVSLPTLHLLIGSSQRHFQTLVHKLEMSAQSLLYDSPRMVKLWPRVVGLAPSNYGTSRPVHPSVLLEVSLAISSGVISHFTY